MVCVWVGVVWVWVGVVWVHGCGWVWVGGWVGVGGCGVGGWVWVGVGGCGCDDLRKCLLLTFQYGSSSNSSAENVGWHLGSQRTINPAMNTQCGSSNYTVRIEHCLL